jgi:hypothetical protein
MATLPNEKGPITRAFQVECAGIEPATSGLQSAAVDQTAPQVSWLGCAIYACLVSRGSLARFGWIRGDFRGFGHWFDHVPIRRDADFGALSARGQRPPRRFGTHPAAWRATPGQAAYQEARS